MKLVTYNLRAGGVPREHWSRILEMVGPEILLVQESSAPREHLSPLLYGERHKQSVWSAVEGTNRRSIWGSAIFANSWIPTAIPLPAFQGWVTSARVDQFLCPTGERQTIQFVSLHAPDGAGGYSGVVNRILDMLHEHLGNTNIVLGGDFNLTISEARHSEDRAVVNADLGIQRRLREEFGLINCWQTANPEARLEQTLRWAKNPAICFHCDGLFVPSMWAPYLLSCGTIRGESWDRLSDHSPVVAEFRAPQPVRP